MAVFLQTVGFGIVTSAILALAAVGATLQVGITNYINFAYGDFMTFGAYIAYVFAVTIGLPFAAAAILGGVASAILAVVFNIAIFERFVRRRTRSFTMLVITIGVAFIVQNMISMIWGTGPRQYPLQNQAAVKVGPFSWTPTDIGIILAAALILIVFHLCIQYTKFGKSLRAMSNNQDLAVSCGINARLLTNVVWAITGFFAGIAGVALVLEINSLFPTVGFNELFFVYAAVILGGTGRLMGAMAGAAIMGFALEISGRYVPGGYNIAIAFVVLALALLFRPQGIFAARGRVS